jgi:phosphoadenosine phosphosulfate reductase
MVAQSIEFLKQHEPPEGYYVGFSGGKDSIVSKYLCDMAGVKYTAYYSCTLIDPPEMYKFIRQHHPEVIWLHPAHSFWYYVRRNGPAWVFRRWCCGVLKESPGKKIALKNRVMGIRAEESARRAARGQIAAFGNQMHYKPIFHWKEWHIWEFIEENKIPYPALYDEGESRIGCVICPFCMSNGRIERYKNKYPKMFKIFEKNVAIWLDTKQLKPTKQYGDIKNFLHIYYNQGDRERRKNKISIKDNQGNLSNEIVQK